MLGLSVAAFLASLGFAWREYERMRECAARVARAREHAAPSSRKRPLMQVAKPPVPVPRRNRDGRLEQLLQNAPKGPDGVPLIRPEELFSEYPELEARYVEASSARMADLLAPFALAEGLTPEQRQQLFAIFGQREKIWAELQAAASAQGKAGTAPDIMAQNAVANQQREQALAGLLGPAAYARLADYRKNLDARTGFYRLNAFIEASLDSADPVTPEKMNRIAELVAKNNIYSSARNSPRPGVDAFSTVRREAQEILSPDQLDTFELLLDYRQLEVVRASNR